MMSAPFTLVGIAVFIAKGKEALKERAKFSSLTLKPHKLKHKDRRFTVS
jgi:hypothetical protein